MNPTNMARDHGTFANSMQAKRFLVSRIAEEARRQDKPLSELEEKMLYFSETSPTLPDMSEVAEQFESQFDSGEYEAKISWLSKKAYARDRREAREKVRQWKDAVTILKTEDHYILNMVHIPRSAADILWLILWSFVAIAAMLAVIMAKDWLQEHVRGAMRDKVVLACLAGCLLLYYLSTTPVGKKFGDWLGDRMFEIFERFS